MPGYRVSASLEPVKEGIVCPHCKLILRDAIQTKEEGHRLCESCYKEISTMPNLTCEDCGISLVPAEQIYLDRAVRRIVLQLNVQCNYHTNRCTWAGLLQDLEDHSAQCLHRSVCCPNGGCGQLLVLGDLDRHIDGECLYRRVRCYHCGQLECANSLKEHCGVYMCPKNCPTECGQYKETLSRWIHTEEAWCQWCRFKGTTTELEVHEPECSKRLNSFPGMSPDFLTLTLPSMADADSAIDRMSIDSRCTRNHKQQQRALQPTSDETVRRSREGSVEGDKLLEVPFEVQAADTELQKDLGATSMAR